MTARAVIVSLACVAACLAGAAIAPSSAQDAEPPRTLTPGKGVELTTARCVICHDAQHITRARLSRDEWAYNIKNMIERGAPITQDEIAVILEYLAAYYNRDGAAPTPEAAPAQDRTQQLLTANACIACHHIEQRLVGPSFREVAGKFSGVPGAAATLARKIKEGGTGNWGNVPMPPHPQISDAELDQIVSWVLQQR